MPVDVRRPKFKSFLSDEVPMQPTYDRIVVATKSRGPLFDFAELLKNLGFDVIVKSELIFDLPQSFYIFEIREFSSDELGASLTEKTSAVGSFHTSILVQAMDHETCSKLPSNSINEIHYWPGDQEFVLESVFGRVKRVSSAKADFDFNLHAMSQISILGLDSETPLPFDVFLCLPSNKKLILYRQKGATLDEASKEKFMKFKRYGLFVRKTDLKEVFEHTASVIREGLQKTRTEVERSKEARKHIRSLLDQVLTDTHQDQQHFESQMRRIDKSLEELSPLPEGHTDLVHEIGFKMLNIHGHSRNVATYCRVFALAAGEKELHDFYLGGFLHDLGLLDLPIDVLGISIEKMTEHQLAQFKLHPGNAKVTLEKKFSFFSETVKSMILHHHERLDGKGFPYGHFAKDLNVGAKICAIADHFDYLTSIRPGEKTLSPEQAANQIVQEASIGKFDLRIARRVRSLFVSGSKISSELAECIDKKQLDKLDEILKRSPDNVNEADIDGVTPLGRAVRIGSVEAVRLLINARADLNQQDIDGISPLMTAVDIKKEDVVEILVLAGADTQLRDSQGKSALDRAIEKKHQPIIDLLSTSKNKQAV